MSEVTSLEDKLRHEAEEQIAYGERCIEQGKQMLGRVAIIYSGQLQLNFIEGPDYGGENDRFQATL